MSDWKKLTKGNADNEWAVWVNTRLAYQARSRKDGAGTTFDFPFFDTEGKQVTVSVQETPERIMRMVD